MDHAGVQQEGCVALANLAYNNGRGDFVDSYAPAENAVAIARNGGIDAVVLALKNHRDNANVQQNGCRAIGQFAYKNGSTFEKEKLLMMQMKTE